MEASFHCARLHYSLQIGNNERYMEQRLIGREAELKLLNEYINSDKSEFIAVYGRRRVGKTFSSEKP